MSTSISAYDVYRWLRIIIVCFILIGCAATPLMPTVLLPEKYLYPDLPDPDMTLNIAGLGPCDDSPDRSFRLNSQKPVTVLVHGCLGSAGRFRTLSQVLAFHGQQSACFSYDDRDSMMLSSRQLADALEDLTTKLSQPKITVIGHSQGGLIARKALVSERADPIKADARLGLVTVSAPFSGIRAARFCAIPLVRVLTFGVQDLACKLVSGDKWYEITSSSDFIKTPGALGESVDRYLLITTDEENSCRQFSKDGKCIKDDFVFRLDEQELPSVPTGMLANKVEVQAGHVQIVGETGIVPEKLILVLQQEGYIRPTEASRIADLKAFLAYLYDVETNRHE